MHGIILCVLLGTWFIFHNIMFLKLIHVVAPPLHLVFFFLFLQIVTSLIQGSEPWPVYKRSDSKSGPLGGLDCWACPCLFFFYMLVIWEELRSKKREELNTQHFLSEVSFPLTLSFLQLFPPQSSRWEECGRCWLHQSGSIPWWHFPPNKSHFSLIREGEVKKGDRGIYYQVS